MPLEGIDRQQYLTAKFGGEDNARTVYQRIEDEGKKNKIYFQFNKIAKTPNSFFSHKLLAYAHRKKKQTEVLELLFYKYFIEGEDIGSLDVLISLSQDVNIYDKHIEITDGVLKFYKRKEYKPLTYGFIEESLNEIIPNKEHVEFMLKHLKEKRETVIHDDIRRNYTK